MNPVWGSTESYKLEKNKLFSFEEPRDAHAPGRAGPGHAELTGSAVASIRPFPEEIPDLSGGLGKAFDSFVPGA